MEGNNEIKYQGLTKKDLQTNGHNPDAIVTDEFPDFDTNFDKMPPHQAAFQKFLMKTIESGEKLEFTKHKGNLRIQKKKMKLYASETTRKFIKLHKAKFEEVYGNYKNSGKKISEGN